MTAHHLWVRATDSERKRRILAMVAMLLVALFWAVVETLGYSVPREYSPVQTVWSRYLVHMLFMLVAFGPRQGTRLIRTNCLWMQISRSLLMLGMPLCYVVGLWLIPYRDVWTISWVSSIMLMFMAIGILNERVSATLWLITLIAWVGVWLLLGAEVPSLQWGMLAPLGMGLCYALYKTMTRIMRTESSYANLFHTALWVFCALTLLLPVSWKTPTAGLIGVYIGIGLFGYLTLLCLDKSLELAPAALTAPLIYTQPIWVVTFGVLLDGRTPGLHAVVGTLIIIITTGYLFSVAMRGTRQLVR